MANREIRIYIKFNGRNPTSNKRHNIHLVKFLMANIDAFNRAGNYMDLILCDENNDDDFSLLKHKHGIKGLPVLIYAGKPDKIYGVDDIKKVVVGLCQISNKARRMNNDEIVLDHQTRCMMTGDDEDDDPYETPFNDVAKAATEWQRRQDQYGEFDGNNARGRRGFRDKKQMGHRGVYGQRQTNTRNGEIDDQSIYQGDKRENLSRGRIKIRDNPAELQRNLKGGDMRDNDLMAKFWENNEETKLN